MSLKSGDNSTPSRNKLVLIFKKVSVGVLSLIGFLGTALTVYQWYESRRSIPHIEVEVVDNQCLTNIASVPGLDCEFRFSGSQVRNLWVSKIRATNSCRRNIIGVLGGDLMSSNMLFKVSKGYNILKINDEPSTVGVDIVPFVDRFSMSFKKWRPGEVCQFKVYSEASQSEGVMNGPIFSTIEDPLKEGDVVILDYKGLPTGKRLVDYMPSIWATFFSRFGIGCYSIAFLLSLYWLLIGMGWYSIVARYLWERKYHDVVAKIIVEDQEFNKSDSLSMNRLNKRFLAKHGIPAPKTSSEFVSGKRITWGPLIVCCAVASLLCILFATALAGLIIC